MLLFPVALAALALVTAVLALAVVRAVGTAALVQGPGQKEQISQHLLTLLTVKSATETFPLVYSVTLFVVWF